ncbi:BamA/TamA family outer membrane protein [Roseivirga pacifica]|uniref:BamA/TamA family outer membrane protein n=1 Tax=Roseivirga pacifica TaxID=1267423 RepID=UPI0020952D79|nr:BamA/TamA family outer membrane protein [Roseivirga pacifica]MCO6357532.1 BamA/TamA family outer membrane protein [Roseivirga pacifica]MCO6367703.1 BamA/TamA family outer membrane protein [Roseivirga pacifica]MCO6369765.1 BamA/TamA family outer membrane protein [Roseivirga pacifica]MCO6373619.1 BamA/TamA family outer membrane protein [Roseivirga pacifica]MCO6377076.1 BamA/TamA family outer membrane protein [Roseivirga pacifica]
MLQRKAWILWVGMLLIASEVSLLALQAPAKTDSVTIGNIYLNGNKKTLRSIILRELDFEEGETVSKADFERALVLDQQKLMNTRLFVTAEIVPLYMSDTDVEVLINMQERWYVFPVPIFRLADRNFTEWWVNQKRDFSRVNFGAQLYHMNLTGRNDRLSAKLQFGFTKQYALDYSVPYINKNQKLGMSFGISFATNKAVSYASNGHRLEFYDGEDVLRRTFSTGTAFTYRPSFYTKHTWNIGYSRISVADTVIDLNPNYLGNDQTLQEAFLLGYNFTIDKRDFVSYPLKGSVFRFDADQYGLGVFNDMNMLVTRISFAKFLDLGDKFYLANRADLYKNFGETIPYVRRAGFGYNPDFIRGYEKYVVESDFLLSHRTSFKYQVIEGVTNLNKRSIIPQFKTLPYAFYLKTFMDLGYSGDPLDNNENNFYNNKLIASFGLGLDIVTYYDFVMRLEFSVTEEGNTGFYFNFRSAL